jgi:hypothetical protein
LRPRFLVSAGYTKKQSLPCAAGLRVAKRSARRKCFLPRPGEHTRESKNLQPSPKGLRLFPDLTQHCRAGLLSSVPRGTGVFHPVISRPYETKSLSLRSFAASASFAVAFVLGSSSCSGACPRGECRRVTSVIKRTLVLLCVPLCPLWLKGFGCASVTLSLRASVVALGFCLWLHYALAPTAVAIFRFGFGRNGNRTQKHAPGPSELFQQRISPSCSRTIP